MVWIGPRINKMWINPEANFKDQALLWMRKKIDYFLSSCCTCMDGYMITINSDNFADYELILVVGKTGVVSSRKLKLYRTVLKILDLVLWPEICWSSDWSNFISWMCFTTNQILCSCFFQQPKHLCCPPHCSQVLANKASICHCPWWQCMVAEVYCIDDELNLVLEHSYLKLALVHCAYPTLITILQSCINPQSQPRLAILKSWCRSILILKLNFEPKFEKLRFEDCA